MARTIGANMLTSIGSESATLITFFEFMFSGGVVRFVTAPINLSWASKTWTAIGGELDWDAFTEAPDDKSGGTTLRVAGVDQTILSILLSENFTGRGVRVWYGHIVGGVITTDPLLLFSGYMNSRWSVEQHVDREGSTVTIETRVIGPLAAFRTPRGMLSNVASHRQFYGGGWVNGNGDAFFAFIPTLYGKEIVWGKKIKVERNPRWPLTPFPTDWSGTFG